MALELDPDWPGTSDKDETADPYTHRPEVRRIAGEMNELLDKLTTSSGIPVTEFAIAPGAPVPDPQLPTGAGSLPDLRQYCALSETQLGEWPTALQFSFSISSAYSVLVGEPGTTSGLYASLVDTAGRTFDALLDIAKTSEGAEQASQEAAARQEV
ncbi:hypothetical protein ACFLIM_09530 [Nonomuraea sp. M3C6]|uniref:Uncharacterized protein n=1 Tax=Nonomuraea marmarensis TaxID=3351344 RepID=A0ABW7A8I4_9ACTN